MSLKAFHPAVAKWFEERLGEPTAPQKGGWPLIHEGRNVLISAPTGSGKTLSAFLCGIDALARRGLEEGLPDETLIVYISPLKALANDIQANLLQPLREIAREASQMGLDLPEIRPQVRSGDTPQHERRRMLKHPPHILVTTPESLYILLTSKYGRQALTSVRTVIVDEIHSLARDKRGSHLMLTLERLEALCGRSLQRIGLSATVKPVEEMAHFLAGQDRQCEIVDVGHRRHIDLKVAVPEDELAAVPSHDTWKDVYRLLARNIEDHQTTLIFVNTRRLAERVTHHLSEILGEEQVACHHGSLSKEIRLSAEKRLKQGQLKAVVATASLELGIDIGHVDLVCQIGATRTIALALQRIGRSGHWKGAVPKGRLIALSRDDLLECAALAHAIQEGDLDRILIPPSPLDVLAQQIVAECASREWDEEELFGVLSRAMPYRELARSDYDALLAMLSEGTSTRKGRRGAYLHRDRVNRLIRGRRNARLSAITSGGAIPEVADYIVKMEPGDITVGSVDEDFAIESSKGDVFLLGNTSWRIRKLEAGILRVEDAQGAAPTIPFWFGEVPARSIELSRALSQVRRKAVQLGRDEAIEWLQEYGKLCASGAEQAVDYLRASRRALEDQMPSLDCLVAERFFDESGGMQLIIHSPLGSRLNRAWGLALRKKFCRSFNFELQAAATENGICISLSDQHSFPLESVFAFLSSSTARDVLVQATLDSPLFATRWRWNAGRALQVLRFGGGKKIAPQLQRMRSDDLLASVFPESAACLENIVGDIEVPDHPLVKDTLHDCLTEAMDVEGLEELLGRIEAGKIECRAVDTPEPSPLSHEILNANPYAFLDDAPLEERRARAVQTRRFLPPREEEMGLLDASAIEQVVEEARPLIRDPDELHDALLSLVVLLEDRHDDCREHFQALHPKQITAATGADDSGTSAMNLSSSGSAALDSQAAPAPEAGGGSRDGPTAKSSADPGPQAGPGVGEDPRQMQSASHRVLRIRLDGDDGVRRVLWAAVERALLVEKIYGLKLTHDEPFLWDRDRGLSRQDALREVVRGRLETCGPVTAHELADELGLSTGDIEIALAALEGQGQILRGNFRPGEPALEWCDRRLLARIHRLTLGRLRREIEPVSAANFMRFLFRWQHLAPGTRLHGQTGLEQVLEQLQGLEAPASAWETAILPSRLSDYSDGLLDILCLSGRFAWGRLSVRNAATGDDEPASLPASRSGGTARQPNGKKAGDAQATDSSAASGSRQGSRSTSPSPPSGRGGRPNKLAPVAFFHRQDLDELLSLHHGEDPLEAGLSTHGQTVLEALQRCGASFLEDLIRATGLLPSQVEEGLWELASSGLATADGFDNLRRLIDPKRRRKPVRRKSLRRGRAAPRKEGSPTGRWTLLRPLSRHISIDRRASESTHEDAATGEAGKKQRHTGDGPGQANNPSDTSVGPGADPLSAKVGTTAAGHTDGETVEAYARQMLNRWGVVFRDLTQRETLNVPWRELLWTLRRLESRGEVRGGRFVSGLIGEQFALPEAVDALRQLRRAGKPKDPERLSISAADPLNLTGILLPGPRVRPHPRTRIHFENGVPVDAPSSPAVQRLIAEMQG
ncbi:MAG TPA: DEAD/DEAH box helicase [Acidobacteriota bacterium]|nr:DEAD/DEAH box helicase [Acidobacteriota bacterium]